MDENQIAAHCPACPHWLEHIEDGCRATGKREPNNCSRWLCTSRDCPHFEKMKASATPLELVWHGNSDPCWDFKTAIPHETFEVYDEGILYCRGVVFALADVPTC